VVAVEKDAKAIACATVNLAAYTTSSGRKRAVLLHDDATGCLPELAPGSFDLVVANPPYLCASNPPKPAEVRDWEPKLALYGGGVHGLQIPSGIVRTAGRLLKNGGYLVVEHGEDQAEGLSAIVRSSQVFTEIVTLPDLTGQPRMVCARRHGS
jgi:release factor glutamine methyltransferase